MFSKLFQPQAISALVGRPKPSQSELEEVLEVSDQGLTFQQAAVLVAAFGDPALVAMVQEEAVNRRRSVHDNDLSVITPLYIANGSIGFNGCMDYCGTCAFRRGQLTAQEIRQLTPAETGAEVRHIVGLGSGNVQLVAATVPHLCKADAVAAHVAEAKAAEAQNVGLNIFPLAGFKSYRAVQQAGCDFVILFQETYHKPTYSEEYHLGPKSDMERRLNAHDLACLGEVGTVGLGILGGLYDWRYDMLAVIEHARYLQEAYSANIIIGQYRIKQARGADCKVEVIPLTDDELVFMGYVYSLAIPGVRLWLYANESPELAARCFEGGGSAVTIECSSAVGGYAYQATGPFQFYQHSEPFQKGLEGWLARGFDVQASSL